MHVAPLVSDGKHFAVPSWPILKEAHERGLNDSPTRRRNLMAVINTEFSTVLVHSRDLDAVTAVSPETRRGWLELMRNARKRQQANAAARMELMSHGIDPNQFLSHYRS